MSCSAASQNKHARLILHSKFNTQNHVIDQMAAGEERYRIVKS